MCHQKHVIPSHLSATVSGQVLEEALEQPVSRCRGVAVAPELPYLKAIKSAGVRVGIPTTCTWVSSGRRSSYMDAQRTAVLNAMVES